MAVTFMCTLLLTLLFAASAFAAVHPRSPEGNNAHTLMPHSYIYMLVLVTYVTCLNV